MLESLITDQRTRWGRGERVPVSWYVEKYPTLESNAPLLAELIQNEVSLRTALGETIAMEPYIRAYPQCYPILAPGPPTSEDTSPENLIPERNTSPRDAFSTAMPESQHGNAYATMPGSDATVELQSTSQAGKNASGPFETIASDPNPVTMRVLADSGRFPKVPGFEITGELGRGGMGVVYKARQTSTRRVVALKIVRNDLLDTLAPSSRKATLERFHTEA
ncbi:MAG: hypothetical protein MUF23_17975, partial [Pirellula sp.]|nr:hypothetical protein [Pirellula sp.]